MEESVLEGRNSFSVLLLGIIFNPQRKQILVTRENDGMWRFPERILDASEKVGDLLKEEVRKDLGYDVGILGPVFSSIQMKKKNILQIHYLCEILGEVKTKNENPPEIKWISPSELREYLVLEPELEEYLVNLI